MRHVRGDQADAGRGNAARDARRRALLQTGRRERSDDGDGVVDTADNCPLVSNADQANRDGDSLGDACDEAPVPMFSPAWMLTLTGLLGFLGFWRSRRPAVEKVSKYR